MKSKVVILMFVAFLLGLATLGIFKANVAENKIDTVRHIANEKSLDSIIQKKVDYRFTSYDGRFMYDNLVVIDDNNVVIGKLILYTNDVELDSFYSLDKDWRRTKFYENLKNGTLRVLNKTDK